MTRKRTESSVENQIDELTQQLNQITNQLHQLRLQLQEERELQPTANQRRREGIQIGDRVRITNYYQNLRNTEGIVIRLTTSFVTLRTDNGREITRGTQNVQIIEHHD